MCYHTYAPALGYVQGMSDLLSPIYVVFDADESSSFWAFVQFMKSMVSTKALSGEPSDADPDLPLRSPTFCETKVA